ncbi:MAG: hypothetical protein FWC91_13380 [Defluviitaleaceae bacterium]|nr:hypothetical protein [Defluviitaleaceae bacterium]
MQKKSELFIHVNLIYVFFVPLVLLGKLIRWTILYDGMIGGAIGLLYMDMAMGIDLDIDEEGPGPILTNIILFLNRFGVSTFLQFEIIFTIVWNFITFLLLLKIKKHLTIIETIFVSLSIIVLNIFAFTLSKEPIQMLYFLLIFFILCKNSFSGITKSILSIGALLFSAITFRTYFGLIVLYMWAAQVIMPIFMSKKRNLVTALTMLLLLSSLIYFSLLTLGPYLPVMSGEQHSELVRVRQQQDRLVARTLISASTRVDTFPWMAVNYFLIMLRLMFPFELLPFGIQFFPYTLYQLVITYIFLKCLASYRENPPSVNLAMFIYFGFLATSGAYQPDFGSWVRHSSVLFPIFLVMMKIRSVDIDTARIKKVY